MPSMLWSLCLSPSLPPRVCVRARVYMCVCISGHLQDEILEAIDSQEPGELADLGLEALPVVVGQADGEAPASAEPAPAPAPAGDGSMYSLAELQAGCPDGVVASSKEKSLNDADFEATFKMSREEFDALPKWKRDIAKKDAKIF